MAPPKSEINILKELCELNEFVSSKYAVFEINQLGLLPPTFKAECKYVYNNTTFTATIVEKTKKLAKTNVAKLILEQLLNGNLLDLSDVKIAKILGRKPEPKPCPTPTAWKLENNAVMKAAAPAVSLPGPSRDIPIFSTATNCSSSGVAGSQNGFDEFRHGKTAHIQTPDGGWIKKVTLSSTFSERDVLDSEALKIVEPITLRLSADKKFSLPKDFKFVEDAKPMSMADDPRSGLDKYCRDNRLKMPKFFDGGSSGPSHIPFHAIICVIGETFYQVGVFKDKKIARRISAIKMLDALGKLNGNFGDLLVGSVKQTEEEVCEDLAALNLIRRYQLAELEHNPPKKPKFLNTDFHHIENLKIETANQVANAYTNALESANGNCSKELLAFALSVQNEIPWIFKPIQRYTKWLNNHKKGIEGFFNELKAELNAEVEMQPFVPVHNNCEYAFTALGKMKFPWDLKFQLTRFCQGHTLQEAYREVMVEMIMHIGILAAHIN